MARLGLGTDRASSAARPSPRCAPSCPWSPRPRPGWAPAATAPSGRCWRSAARCAGRRRTRLLGPRRRATGRGWGCRLPLGSLTCPTSPSPDPSTVTAARGCCCSTATRWPTARSSRCRSRTSPPPPASTPTRSTASPRCSSTCCATSSRPTSAVAFDVSRADVPHRGVRRLQGEPLQVARRVLGPGLADQGGARRAADRRSSRRTATRPTTSSARSTTQALGRGLRGADLHRRPRRVPAGHRPRPPCSTRRAGSPSWPG